MNQTKEKIEWLLCPICSNKTSSILSKMQKRKLNQRKQFKSNHCKRARRKDAEPIIPRMS